MQHLRCKLRDENTILEITVAKNDPINAIYIDTFKNRAKYKSNNADDHEFSFITHNILGNVEYTNTEIKYNIPASMIGADKYSDVYLVTGELGPNVSETQIVFNDQLLYCFRLALMDRVCVPCTDLKNFEHLEILMMRELMFRESVKLSRIDEALNWWSKIQNMQGNSTVLDSIKSSTSCGCKI